MDKFFNDILLWCGVYVVSMVGSRAGGWPAGNEVCHETHFS